MIDPVIPLDDTVHQWAHAYADLGLRVLPIKPGEKRPPMSAWQDAATTDPATIDAWWTGLYRDHGIGIATGRSSAIFVLDVDVADGKTGDETLADLEAAYGPLPDTPTVITGSGGRHYYFHHPLDRTIRNDAGKRLGPGLDIRGEGGQVVAPPTVGRLQRYEWEVSPLEHPIAHAPGWLLALLEDPTPQPAPTPPPASVDDSDSIAALFNQRTTWADLLTADGWTLAATLADGEQRWTRPGKDTREGVSATTGHGGGDYLNVFTSSVPQLEQDRAYSRFGYEAAMRHGGNRSACARALRLAEPRTELDVPGLTTWTPAAPGETSTRLELAHLVDWQRFWDDDHSDEQWLAYPIVPTGRAIALYAPAKAGKSTITLAIAAAVATGRPVLGRRIHPQVDVLYLDYEMTQADLQQRLMELGYGPDDDLSRLHYALLPSLPPLDTVEGATAILDLCDATSAQFSVIDTFGRAVGGEEDHADTVRNFYRHTGLALKARGITYLRTDHSGKDVAKGMRGSSAKNDDVDLVWQLSRTDTDKGHGVRLRRTHSRVAWVPEEVKVLRTETDDGYDYVIDGDVRAHPDGTRQAMELLMDIGVTASTSQRDLVRALDGAGVKMPRRVQREALKMLKEADIDGLTLVPLVPAKCAEPAPATAPENGGAPAPKSGAVGAPKGDKGSQGGALAPSSGAPVDEYRAARASLIGDAAAHQRSATKPDDDYNPFS